MTTSGLSSDPSPCPLCKHEDHAVISETDRHGGRLRTVMCRSCGHVFTNPQPTDAELKSFYEDVYRTDYKGTVVPKLKHVYRAGMRALERHQHLAPTLKPRARLLDIGSGGGEFVYLMSVRGFDARGIEPNRGYATFSRDAYGIDVASGRIEDMPSGDQPIDIMTMHHVLEHVADPIDVLTKLRSHLSSDGQLVVEVPNVEARYHAPHRQYHRAHLHTFSMEGLAFAGHQAGFAVAAADTLPHTNHIHMVFTPTDQQSADPPDPAVTKRIEQRLRTNTAVHDMVSARPYRRLWANLKRPVRERLALRTLGNPSDAKTLLDHLYERETNP